MVVVVVEVVVLFVIVIVLVRRGSIDAALYFGGRRWWGCQPPLGQPLLLLPPLWSILNFNRFLFSSKNPQNRDSTASVTDEEAPNKSHLNHHHHPPHHYHHLYLPHSPHYHNQIHFPPSACSTCHHPLTNGHHRRNGVTPPRLGSCSPSRRFSDVKKQLLHKNNRQPKKSIALGNFLLLSLRNFVS